MNEDRITLPTARPGCSKCRCTGTMFYRSGPDDISHDICDCIVEQGYYEKAANLGHSIAQTILNGGRPCR